MQNVKFVLRTNCSANPNRQYHELRCYSMPGDEKTAVVRVRFNYGKGEESPYTYTYGYEDYRLRSDFVELITCEEYKRRCEEAKRQGQTHIALEEASVDLITGETLDVYHACQSMQRQFDALMALNLFDLPITA